MPIYRVLKAYEATVEWRGRHDCYSISKRLGPWKPGDRVELETELAEWVNRDGGPGTVEPDEKR
jgi:hypothetical protein